MSKIKISIEWEVEVSQVIQKSKRIWELCKQLKTNYPTARKAIVEQYNLDCWSDKKISDELFDRKLEIMFLQDDEIRNE